jgi:hypothetical protein
MTDRVDPAAHNLQTTGGNAVVHCVLSQAQDLQLPSRNDTVLPLSQASDIRIRALLPSPLLAKPSQPVYIAG